MTRLRIHLWNTKTNNNYKKNKSIITWNNLELDGNCVNVAVQLDDIVSCWFRVSEAKEPQTNWLS